ncbi:DNA primase [Alkanindiges sp. WGS2144]|uniref:DNA primase n=1 Tax=Alkanindiges sp. WGS2144 TaxID=3366808 RepID=UPI003752812A
MAIPQHTIDQVLDRIDLVELIGSRIKLKKSGKTYSACCPFHQEKTPSFNVDRNKGFYHCFGCQASGNAIGFLMQYENRNFIDVIQDLAQQAGIELPKNQQDDHSKFSYKRVELAPRPASRHTPANANISKLANNKITANQHGNAASHDPFDLPPEAHEQPQHLNLDDIWHNHPSADPEAVHTAHSLPAEGNLYDLLEQVAQFYQQQLAQHRPAQAYLSHRGLDKKTCQEWRIGYAPSDWQHLQQHFGQDVEGLKTVGLIRDSDKGRSYDLLRDRVIFPIRDSKGRVVGFGGRAMSDDVKPKYINSPESVIFHKSAILYGLFEGRQARAAQWLMVEGYMDVIALHQAGLAGAVATLGTATNVEHLNLLFKQNSKITLAFDGDAAGQRAAWRTLELALPALSDSRELHFLVLPEQHDPDSLIRLEGLAGIRRRIEHAPPLSDFLFESLARDTGTATPEQKTRLLSQVKALTRLLPNSNREYGYTLIKDYRDRLGLGFKHNKPDYIQEKLLSFEQLYTLEDIALIVLLHYPEAYPLMQELGDCVDASSRLGKALKLIEATQQNMQLLDDEYLFFLIAAWPDEKERLQLCNLMNQIEINSIIFSPEDIEGWCNATVLKLKQKYTTRMMQTNAATMQATHAKNALKEQLLIKRQQYTLSLKQAQQMDEQ